MLEGGGIEPRSAELLREALLGKPSRLSLLHHQVTTALARLIGRLERRNTSARAVQAGTADRRAYHDAEDDDAAWALYLEEARLERLLDGGSPETSTSDPTLDSL